MRPVDRVIESHARSAGSSADRGRAGEIGGQDHGAVENDRRRIGGDRTAEQDSAAAIFHDLTDGLDEGGDRQRSQVSEGDRASSVDSGVESDVVTGEIDRAGSDNRAVISSRSRDISLIEGSDGDGGGGQVVGVFEGQCVEGGRAAESAAQDDVGAACLEREVVHTAYGAIYIAADCDVAAGRAAAAGRGVEDHVVGQRDGDGAGSDRAVVGVDVAAEIDAGAVEADAAERGDSAHCAAEADGSAGVEGQDVIAINGAGEGDCGGGIDGGITGQDRSAVGGEAEESGDCSDLAVSGDESRS